MKVLLFNGSPERANGCTYLALAEIAKTLEADGIGTETLSVGSQPVWDCIGCNHCQSAGLCVFEEDVVNTWIKKAREADGFVFGSPVYFAHPSGHLLSVMDRMFMAGRDAFAHKSAAAVVTAELVDRDQEGLQTMRNLARNMAWMLQCIQLGKEHGVTPPVAETAHWTNFNR